VRRAAPAATGAAGLPLRVAGARNPSVAGEVDAGAILELANAAVTVWPDDPFYSED
jgi:hypothetical protein